jgi:hypothetical protein
MLDNDAIVSSQAPAMGLDLGKRRVLQDAGIEQP